MTNLRIIAKPYVTPYRIKEGEQAEPWAIKTVVFFMTMSFATVMGSIISGL